MVRKLACAVGCCSHERADEGLILYRKLCLDDYDAGLVPFRAVAGGPQIQQGTDGREHLSRYLECGEKYRDGMHCFQITGLACGW